MSIATSTLAESVLIVVTAFGKQITAAAGDATQLNHVIFGLADGNDYGRYSATEDPLVPFVASATTVFAMITQGALLRTQVANAIAAAIEDATGDIGNLWADMLTMTGALRRACAHPGDAIRILLNLTAFTLTPPAAVVGDPIGQQIANLMNATARLARRSAAISLAVASADYAPTSYQDAANIRYQIEAAFATVIQEAADNFDDNAYVSLDALNSAISADLTARGGDLSLIVNRSFGATQPALVLAYRLYQDSTRADDLIARNDPLTRHPAFLPPAVEVLSS